jgi:outer membrane protein assembly factor BamA
MRRRLRFFRLVFFAVSLPGRLYSQTATLHEVRAEGMKTFTEVQVASLSGLSVGSQVSKKDLQDASDLLVRSGLFAKVTYKYDTHNDAVTVTFRVEESPRLRVVYDNLPWYSDSELNDAIRKNLSFFDGTLPEGGTVVELAGNSLAAFLAAHGAQAEIQHFVLADPLSDDSVQQFQVAGLSQKIASVEFSDATLKGNRAVQQHLSEIVGKPYSRLALDLFLVESIRPIYLQSGNLRAKIGPAEVRLSGNPNQKLPVEIPIYVPCEPGPVYQWKGAEWSGNSAVSTETLNAALGMKAGDVANGMNIEGGFDRSRNAYGHLGYLEVALNPVPAYDDQTHTVSYKISVVEGRQYRYNAMTVTGMSLTGERMIRDAWSIKPGDVFDKVYFERFLTQLESHREAIFRDLPVHYDTVGHWLQTEPTKGTVDVLLDFK